MLQLLQCSILNRQEKHRQDVDLKETPNDTLELQAYDAKSQLDRLESELVSGKLVIALDGAGNERCKVEGVEEVGPQAQALVFVAIRKLDE